MDNFTSAVRRCACVVRDTVAIALLAVFAFAGADPTSISANPAPAPGAAAVRTEPLTASAQVEAAQPATPEPSSPVVADLLRQAPGLHEEALQLALRAVENASRQGLVPRTDLLTVIDYTLPSTEPRLFVFDLERRSLLFRELVAHGKNSGDNRTTRFSNRRDSLETSIGLFVTASTYVGGNGYSLRLRGLDEGFNDQAWSRSIVMHGASYVSETTARALGRIGRSWGCPALSPKVARKVIDTVKDGSAIFAYYPDTDWLQKSRFL